MRLVLLAIVVSLVLSGHAQTVDPTPMPTEGTPFIGGCLASLLTTSDPLLTIQSDPNISSPMLVVRRRGSSRRFPPPGIEDQGADGKAVFSNESREVVVMNLTQIEKRVLEDDPNIERVEPDRPMCVDILEPEPDPDPANGASNRSKRSFEPDEICWNIDRCDERGLPPLDGVYCPPVDGRGVDVYILDSGIRYSHQVFGGRASFGGYDEFGGRGDDDHGHGTHCAGLAVGRLTGVAWGARVFSIKVLNSQLAGFFSYVINGINHVIDRTRSSGRRSVISMSLIGPITPAVNDAIREAVANNIVVVTAAGNFRQDSCGFSPSSSPDVINVGAIQEAQDPDSRTPGHQLYWFNSRSNSPGSNYGRCVDIFAPGQWIRSASHTSDRDRVSMSGTSMACPTAAGAVALLLQRYPGDTPERIRRRLQDEASQGIINMRTYRGGFLPTIINVETTNRLIYTGKARGCRGFSPPPTPTSTTVTPTPTPSVPPPPAGCVRDGVLYDHATSILFNCSANCTCRSGTWDCQPRNCYDDFCQTYSLGHFKTFDGTQYNVHGHCEYVLAKPCGSDDFIISAVYRLRKRRARTAIYRLRNRRAWISKIRVSLLVPKLRIELRRNMEVIINNNRLDNIDGNRMTVGEVTVQWIGSYPHVMFEDREIDVFWDETGSAQVSVSSSHRNNLCGMCGYYSGSSSDDFRKSDGTVTQNITDFALSWLHRSRNNRQCVNPISIENNCPRRQLRNSRRVCGLMSNPPFDACNSIVDPQPYISDCEFNFCACKRNSRDRCACSVLASYARACAKAGVEVENWRDGLTECSAGCIGTRVYRECGSHCQLTCDNYQSPPFCSTDCTPTCVCPEGEVLRNGQCIAIETCFEEPTPTCGGTELPPSSPFFFERFYLAELEDFINDGLSRRRIPCHINVYQDNQDQLFSMIFCLVAVQEFPDYIVVHNASRRQVLQMSNDLSTTHMLETFGCYFAIATDERYRCIAVFRPGSSVNQTVHIRINYDEYQQRLLNHIDRGFNVHQRKIYYDNEGLKVDCIFERGFRVSVRDAIDIRSLHQLVEANQQRGLYLADGNARLEDGEVKYSVVFNSQTFGNCEYRVDFNLDALQLFNLERQIAPRCHITVIIPNTGSLTPQYIAVFWCKE